MRDAMNRLSTKERAQIVAALVEGNSIRATCRLTGAAKGTVLKLLADLGAGCARYQDEKLMNLPCKRIQCDEIWSFCYAKQKNVPTQFKDRLGFGDIWTWTAICADTKLAVAWLVGERSIPYAMKFMNEIASRLSHRIQLTTDGHHPYIEAVDDAFAGAIDHAVLDKLYRNPPRDDATRYSPAKCCGTKTRIVTGNPDPEHISTSYVERQNLTMRMSMRRFTRLTNAFSKKLLNLRAAVNLHFMFYNFARIHQTIRVTPAMEAGVSDHVWSVEEIAGLLDSN